MAGCAIAQNPTARTLMLMERHQDATKLLEVADMLNVMLIVGEGERHMFPDRFEAFIRKTFAKSEVVIVKDAGHIAFWEQADMVNVTIKAFVEKIWA